jgi:GDP/UDP-N,N'-diacetylbacillosamine 2-epimerase (hydrolysing)
MERLVLTRRIAYVSGTRADFGLMRKTLCVMDADERFDVSVIVTGMHLCETYGSTVGDIRNTGLRISSEIPVELFPANGATMARGLGSTVVGITEALGRERPDLLLLLGDRAEMLAGALAAIHLNIPVAHLHGGERSGTVDEPIRHAISKLSHLHLVSTEQSRNRLIRMGEREDRIWVTGAPGLDELTDLSLETRDSLCGAEGLDSARPVALFVYHPVLQEADSAGDSAETVIATLLSRGMQIIAIMPNSDAGSDGIRRVLQRYQSRAAIRVHTHLARRHFLGWVACCDLMIGNSSAGIVESSSFGTPVVNLGSRQDFRERNHNVIDAEVEEGAIMGAIEASIRRGRSAPCNIYGDGNATARIVSVVASTVLDSELLRKANVY